MLFSQGSLRQASKIVVECSKERCRIANLRGLSLASRLMPVPEIERVASRLPHPSSQ